MSSAIPTEEEVLDYFQSLSNWGRWGADDQMGTLNFLSPEKTRQAVSLVQEGVSLSCSRTIAYDSGPDVAYQPVHFMVESGEGWATGNKVTSRDTQGAVDFVGLVFHGFTVTHIGSLSHFFWEGKMYNGRPAHLVSTNLGATVESIEVAKNGIVSRAVLVDVPMIRGVDWLERGEGVMPEDILAAEERCGFTIEEGDILLVRTGQLHRRSIEGPVVPRVDGSTACQVACLPLFRERSIAMLGSDTPNDVFPSGYGSMALPVHQVGIVAMGLWLLDNADLDELARACIERNRWEFMLSAHPLRLFNTTGSPVNPIATF